MLLLGVKVIIIIIIKYSIFEVKNKNSFWFRMGFLNKVLQNLHLKKEVKDNFSPLTVSQETVPKY